MGEEVGVGELVGGGVEAGQELQGCGGGEHVPQGMKGEGNCVCVCVCAGGGGGGGGWFCSHNSC